MKNLILFLLALSFLVSCSSDIPPIVKEKGVCIPERIGGVSIGCVYGKESDKFDSLNIFRKTKNIGN